MNFARKIAFLVLFAGALGTTITADGYIASAVALDVDGVMTPNPELKTCLAACDAVKIGCAADFAGSSVSTYKRMPKSVRAEIDHRYISAWEKEAEPVCCKQCVKFRTK
jgi:hypothetical protein